MHNILPKEIDFINQYRFNEQSLERATWRISPFGSEIWYCKFGEAGETTIDFRIKIDDDSLLTAQQNQALLNSIKSFLCLQTHPAITGSVTLSPSTARAKIAIALHLVDYFLLQGKQIGLAKKHFQMITADDVMLLIDKITSHRSIKANIYEPIKHITSFLSEVEVPDSAVFQLKSRNPDLFDLDGVESEWLLPHKKLLIARAWLKHNEYYLPVGFSTNTEFKYRVNRWKLLRHAIGDRVLSGLKFDGLILDGLDVSPTQRFSRELPGVPVNNLDEDERASDEYTTSYISVLQSMKIARQLGVNLIPNDALTALDESAVVRKERTKERARFTTLPFELANQIFRNAIEFYLEYGETLVEYYLSLAAAGDDVRKLRAPIPKKLRRLGVNCWRINADTPADFFSELRKGRGLYNMLEVLFGAIAIIVNTLMARRASELEGLTKESIVKDDDCFFLAFDLRKANVLEHRQRTLRPLPHIGAKGLQLLAKLSTTLSQLGYETGGLLFEFPYSAWKVNSPFYGTCQPDLRRCLDRFCDYFQTATDDNGRRYYVRSHQLRRNFALIFFWHGSFGGVEVLRHFLGHQNPSMTYHYVTEALPGKILRRVKATVAKDMIRSAHEATQGLAQLICQRYGLTLDQLHILPERDVVDYVEDLLVSGEAEVEPEFIKGPHGEEYRVVYKITDINPERRT